MTRALLAFAFAGCSSASIGPDPAASIDQAIGDGAAPVREAAAAPPDAGAPATGPTRYAQLGDDCAGTLGCEANPYEGPLILSWACYPAIGNRCSFDCNDCANSPADAGDGSAGSCQQSYLQPAPPVCGELGGHCVDSMGLDGGHVSLCVR